MTRSTLYIFLLGIFVIVIMPNIATAAIVPCEGDSCTACELITLGNNIIKFLIMVGVLFATILLMYAGYLMVSAQGNRAKIENARSIFTNVVIGISIMLLAFLIVDTFMKTFLGPRFLPDTKWYDIRAHCVPNALMGGGGQGGVTSVPTVSPTSGTPGCPNCVPITGGRITCKEGANCSVDSAFAANLVALSGEVPFRVTEGYPPTVQHRNPCHASGTCLDVTFTGNMPYTSENILRFQNAAQENGYRAVFEPGPSQSCPTGVQDCLAGVATGAHFSLYRLPQ